MSAMVCGKRSFFEELDAEASPPGAACKKYRYSSSASPARFIYSPPSQDTAVDQLRALFPAMETELLEKALKESGNNLELATKRLREHCLGYSKDASGPTDENSNTSKCSTPSEGAEWVDLLLKEMTSATSIDDARFRISSVLESLEKSIRTQASVAAAQSFVKESEMAKEQIEALFRDNAILKRAVAIQHERQKENDEKNQEVVQLKQLVVQYQEQLRNLEMKNYSLTLHLRQAEQRSSIPGRFNPDVF